MIRPFSFVRCAGVAGLAVAVSVTAFVAPMDPYATPAVAATAQCSNLDSVQPQISDIRVSRRHIDLHGRPGHVTISEHITDTASDGGPGDAVASEALYDENNSYLQLEANLRRVSGTPASGTWADRIWISPLTKSGTFALSVVNADDANGNFIAYNSGSGSYVPTIPDEANTTLTVTRGRKPPKGHQPSAHLTGVHVTGRTIDVRRHSASVPISVTVSAGHLQGVSLTKPTKGQQTLARLHRVHGSRTSWAGHIRVPRWYHGAQRTVQRFGIRLKALGVAPRSYRPAELARQGFAHAIRLSSHAPDNTAPVISGLSLSRSAVDVTQQSETVGVTVKASDASSDVIRVKPTGASTGGRHRISPYLPVFSKLTHRSGHTWTGTITFPKCAAPQTYESKRLNVFDAAGNEATATAAELGHPSVSVTSNWPADTTRPTIPNTPTYTDQTVTIDFSEPVEHVNAQTLRIGPDYNHALAVSSITCSANGTTMPCDGSQGGVDTAVYTLARPLQDDLYYVNANSFAVTPQLTDASGNPMWDRFYAAFFRVSK